MTTTFTSEQIQHIKLSTMGAFSNIQTDEATAALGENWFACNGCIVGLNIVAGAAIGAALVVGIATLPEDATVVSVIAEFCGVAANTVKIWLSAAASGGAATVEAVISAICKAWGACSG